MSPILRASRPCHDNTPPTSRHTMDPLNFPAHIRPIHAMPTHAPCRILALTPDDTPTVERMLRGLDRDSRCARFGWASSDESLMTHARGLFVTATHLIGAFADGELRGILEIYADNAARGAEVALVVAPPWRRRGFGQAMLAAALAWAAQNRVGAIHLIFSRENWPMRRLAETARAKLDIALDEICAEIAVSSARPPEAAPDGAR